MRVAVLGGGLQGCCIALALADRGVKVTLFDKNESLLSRAAIANEGKIHLGYMYAGDPTLSTARTMMQGALAFAPFFARHLGLTPERMTVSIPAAYVVHRDSQRGPEEISRYLAAVHRLVGEAADKCRDAYFGIDLGVALREWTAAERDMALNSDIALAAFDSPEVAINPIDLATALNARIAGAARIEVRLAHTVRSLQQNVRGVCVVSTGPQGASHDSYDHVVNALWDGRLAIDATLGHRPGRPWLHRLKYGISFRRPDIVRGRSVTIILGPFGEVVSYPDGLAYLTWYPECLQGMSGELSPPDWVTYPPEPLRSRLLKGTLAALSDIVPSLRDLNPNELSDVSVKGGVIVAWGQTDIDDPQSELHHRFEIGVTSAGRFHSVDPGKLTMAPYFADVCADRIAPIS